MMISVMSVIAHRCTLGFPDVFHHAQRDNATVNKARCAASGRKTTWHGFDEQPEIVLTYRDGAVVREISRPGSVHADLQQLCGCDACWALWEIHDGQVAV